MTFMLTGCHSINQSIGLQDNNPIEHGVEQVIEEKTGVHIEFTPSKQSAENQAVEQQAREVAK